MFNAGQFDRVKIDAEGGGSDPEGTLYVAELSELRKGFIPPQYFAMNDCPLPGQKRSFHFVKHDKVGDFPGADIAGWRYEEDNGRDREDPPFTVLIIND